MTTATNRLTGFSTIRQTAMNLSNHFLIAMPSMHDPIFGGSVVYLCEHNERGALGVVIVWGHAVEQRCVIHVGFLESFSHSSRVYPWNGTGETVRMEHYP